MDHSLGGKFIIISIISTCSRRRKNTSVNCANPLIPSLPGQAAPRHLILISLRNTAIVITVIYIFYFTKPAYLSEHQIYFVKVFNGNLMNRDLWMTINAGCISTVFIYYGLILPSLPFLLRGYSCKSCLNELSIISAPRRDKEIHVHFLERSLGMRRSIVNEYVYEGGEQAGADVLAANWVILDEEG